MTHNTPAPVADKALAERLARLMDLGDHESSSLDDRVNLSIALRAAHRSGQLITLAEADARVAARDDEILSLIDKQLEGARALRDAARKGNHATSSLINHEAVQTLENMRAAIHAAATGTREGV